MLSSELLLKADRAFFGVRRPILLRIPMNSALFYENLKIGQTWVSPKRTITQADVVIFAGMTGDYDRLHVDHQYANNSRFGQPLAHGMMGMAWAAGLSTTAPAVNTLALASIQDWKFLLPVHIGDTVHVVTEVVTLESAGRSAGRVTWKKSLINQENQTVQAGNFISLVELGSRVPASHIGKPAHSTQITQKISEGKMAPQNFADSATLPLPKTS